MGRDARPTALVTLGRLPKALDLARGLDAAGWRVVVAEPFGWHLAKASRAVAKSIRLPAPAAGLAAYRAALAAAAAAEGARLVVPVSEEIFAAAGAAPDLPAGCRMVAEPVERLLALHDKLAFARTAAGLGLAAPQSWALGSREAADLARAADHVVKPRLSSAGRGVRLARAGDPLPDPDPARPALVQARLPGAQLATFGFAWRGRTLATVVYRGLIVAGTVAVAFERVDDRPDIVAWAEAFAAGLGWSGFLSFDFADDAAGRPHAFECNPRATSGLHFLDAASLAAAIADPEGAPAPIVRPERRLQQFYPALTETQARIFNPAARRRNLAALRGCRDVTWRAADPWPFLLMPALSWRILADAVLGGVSMGEAATRDIGWYGTADAAAP